MKRTRTPDPITTLRADSLFNPYLVVIALSPNQEEYASVDARYNFIERVNVYARSDYDVNMTKLSRAELSARVAILPALSATAEYLFREPRVAYNSIFSVFKANSTQEVEAGVEYEVSPLLRTYARFADVVYKISAGVNDNSGRVTVGGSYDFVNFSYTQNFGYAGDLNGVSIQAIYPMMDRTLTPNFGFGFANYQLSDSDTKNTVLNTSIGATYRPKASLSTDVQLQWMRNPLYANDVRLFVKVNYWFAEHLSWF
jgi:predicted porin